MRFYIPSIRKQ